jgi:hypothetical protein
MSARDAAIYLGYVAIFSAVVAWGYLLHAPRGEAPEAATGQAVRMVNQAPAPAVAGGERVTVSVVQ